MCPFLYSEYRDFSDPLVVGMSESHRHLNTNGGMRNESSVGTCTQRMHVFARLGADL